MKSLLLESLQSYANRRRKKIGHLSNGQARSSEFVAEGGTECAIGLQTSHSITEKVLHLSSLLTYNLRVLKVVCRNIRATDLHSWQFSSLHKITSPLHDKLTQPLNRLPKREKAAIAESLERIVEMMESERLDRSAYLKIRCIPTASQEF